jgi:hypothetical protein
MERKKDLLIQANLQVILLFISSYRKCFSFQCFCWEDKDFFFYVRNMSLIFKYDKDLNFLHEKKLRYNIVLFLYLLWQLVLSFKALQQQKK